MVGETPNIDRIGQEGAKFMDYVAMQSCTSGRNAFFTGMYPLQPRRQGPSCRLPADRGQRYNVGKRKMRTILTASLLVLSATAAAAQTTYYGSDGDYLGQGARHGNTTTYYDSRGSYVGNSVTTGGVTSFFGPDGAFQGTLSRTGEMTNFYDRAGRYQGSVTTVPPAAVKSNFLDRGPPTPRRGGVTPPSQAASSAGFCRPAAGRHIHLPSAWRQHASGSCNGGAPIHTKLAKQGCYVNLNGALG
jgi:hypothetical protein